jgi:AraC-like DNA-binding protein
LTVDLSKIKETMAERAGYESVYAFNRAFNRQVGEPPAAWRKKGSALQATR